MPQQALKFLNRLVLGSVLAAITITPSSLIPNSATAQEIRRIDLKQFPTQGATVQTFVPKGWKVEAKAEGDLNNDNSSDTVLKLIGTALPGSDPGVSRNRALLVLQKQSNGQWQRIGIAPRLLLCSNCGGVLGSPDGSNIQVKIEKGVILVRQFRGSREAIETLHRFWLDKPSNRIVLIGQDVRQYDRLTGDATLESSNFLTGQKTTEQYRANSQRNGIELVSRKRSSIAKTKPAIETVDIEAIKF